MIFKKSIRGEEIKKLLNNEYWNYYVYQHIFPNNKQYVGVTCNNPKIRWNNGKGYKSNKSMYNDILLYGWNNIQHLIIKQNLNEYDAFKLEKEIIIKEDLLNPNKGYNHTTSFSPYINRTFAIIIGEDIGKIVSAPIDYYDNLHKCFNKIDKFIAIELANLYTDLLCDPKLYDVKDRELLIINSNINKTFKNRYVDPIKIFNFLLAKPIVIKWLTNDVCKVVI